MSSTTLRDIDKGIPGRIFTIMADECVDMSSKSNWHYVLGMFMLILMFMKVLWVYISALTLLLTLL